VVLLDITQVAVVVEVIALYEQVARVAVGKGRLIVRQLIMWLALQILEVAVAAVLV
jgi:hypothetical protein